MTRSQLVLSTVFSLFAAVHGVVNEFYFASESDGYLCPGMVHKCEPPKVCARDDLLGKYYCCDPGQGNVCWTGAQQCGAASGQQSCKVNDSYSYCCLDRREECTQIEDQMNICWAPENPLANVPVQKASEAYSSLSSASPQATAWSWDLQNVQAPLNNPSPADEPAEEPVSPPQTSDRQAPTESPDQPSPTSSEDTPDQASDTASPKSDAESESNSDSTAASSSADSRDSSATSLPTGASTTDILSLTRIVDAPVSPTNEDQPVAANSKGGLSGGALAGIVVGAVAGVVMIAAVAFLLWRRKRQPNPYASELDGNAFHGHGGTEVAEKYGYDANDYSHELHCAHPPVEMDGTGQKTAELPSPDVKSGFDATITHMGGYERYKG